MISDNASTYKEVASKLKNLFDPEVITTINRRIRHGTIWQFVLKKAPWFGGFWECLIGLTKAAPLEECM